MWPATGQPNASDSHWKRGLNGDPFEAAVVFESFLPLSQLFQSIEGVEGCSCGSHPLLSNRSAGRKHCPSHGADDCMNPCPVCPVLFDSIAPAS